MWLDHNILMIPGPSEPYQRVVAALSRPVLPHYGSDWNKIYNDTCYNLRKIFDTKQDVIIVPGCGNAGIELAIANITEKNDKILVVHDGFFAEVFKQLIDIYEGIPLIVSAEYGKTVKIEAIKETLEKEGNVKAICTVYNETSTGVKHNLEEIGKIAREFDLYNIVDAVSAFGGMELKVDDWNIDICVGYPSKSLGGIHGAVPVAISDRMWGYIERRKTPIRTRFLNLKLWRKCIDEWSSWGHPYPTAMPASVIIALKEATEIALREGLENRFLRHRICKEAVREAIKSLNLELLADDEDASETVTSVKLPSELEYGKIISLIQKEFNITIGSTNLVGINGLRIGHMGLTASPHYILPTLFALENTLNRLGWRIPKGEAVKRATEVFYKYIK